jgi:hypothetical protein
MSIRRLWRLCGWLAIPYGASLLAAQQIGIRALPPWEILLPLSGVAVPYAYCLTRLLLRVGDRLGSRPALVPAGAVLAGLLVVIAAPPLGDRLGWVLALFYVLLAVDARRFAPGYVHGLVAALVAVSLGLGAVCNVNYLLAPGAAAALNDPALMRLDLALYAWLLGGPVSYPALFPLVRSPAAFHVLEAAYQLLFAELLVVVLALLWVRGDPGPFLRTVFLSYFVGVIAFAVYPAVGPCIHYPESFAPAFEPTATHHLMRELAAEFDRAAAGRPGSGLAYFIAVPSLHAALAVICQRFLTGSRFLFWSFLPVNVAVLLSTVLLGYHYVVDVPCGIALAAAAMWVVERTPCLAGGPAAHRDTDARPALGGLAPQAAPGAGGGGIG